MKEKTADEMFFELGYKKSEVKEFISFSKKENRYRTAKEYEICLSFCCIDKSLITKNKQYFSIEEIQAINKKYQEFGWLD